MLGPGFQCGTYGHIAKFCNVPRRLYPLVQPVVSSAEVLQSAANSAEYSCCQSVDGGTATSNVCVNLTKPSHGTVKEGVDGTSIEHETT